MCVLCMGGGRVFMCLCLGLEANDNSVDSQHSHVCVGVGVCVVSYERLADAEETSVVWSPDVDAYQPTTSIYPKEQTPMNAKTICWTTL